MKYTHLQLGRGVAACWVIVHHLSTKLSSVAPDAPPLLTGWMTKGWIGVDFFFVLSGFIIAMSLSTQPRLGTFLVRRIARIFPPYWAIYLITLVGALAVPTLRERLMEHSAWEWLASVLLLPSANDVPVIGVSWTLQHEVLFYAVAATWLVHRGTAMALGALFLGMPLLADLSAFPQSFLFAPLHWEFALGALAHAVHRKVPSWGANVALLAGLGWMVGMEQLAPAADIREDAARVFQYGIGFALICLGAAARQARATSAGPRAYDAFADRLGSWSFALYLVHVPVIQAMVRAADQARWVNADTTHVLAALVLMACLLSGYAYHTWVETPASQWMLRALRARG